MRETMLGISAPELPCSIILKGIPYKENRMLLSTLTAKGQMTIPKHIRDAMKLRPGDNLAEMDESVRERQGTLHRFELVERVH